MSRVYLMAKSYLDRLLADRRELFSFARSVKNADEMRAARDELMASAQINTTPAPGETVQLKIVDGVAHIPVTGSLTPSADPCGAFTGQAETEYGFIQAALIAAEDDQSVKSIALDINSPGGYLDGLDETAQLLAAVTKPTTAYIGSLGASAAYWLASQADKIVATSPASLVGSIGVAMEEYNDDKALADEGITHRVYTSTDAPDKRPDTNTPEGQAKVISELDALHSVFVRRVAEGRGVSIEKVNSDFGRGGVFTAEKAMAVGMIDEVIGQHISRDEMQTNVGVADIMATGPKNIQGVKKMTPEEIEALKAKAYQDGIQAERKRVADLSKFRGHNADADKAVEEAIASGSNVGDCTAQLVAAIAKGNSKQADGQNAPAVNSQTAATASGADGLDAEDHEAMKLFGISQADYLKTVKGAKNG